MTKLKMEKKPTLLQKLVTLLLKDISVNVVLYH